jgi:hypothetical protein
MDMNGLIVSAGVKAGGRLVLNSGRHIIVKRILHVGDSFLFYSLPRSIKTYVVGHDEIKAWESISAIV